MSKLDILERIAAGTGESVECAECADRHLYYINKGDTYDETLCYDEEEDELFEGSWGGWYEEVEQQHCRENDVIRCGWCSEFTPLSETGEWRDTVCEYCGNLVGG